MMTKEKQNYPLGTGQGAVVFGRTVCGEMPVQVFQELWNQGMVWILSKDPVTGVTDVLQRHAAQLLPEGFEALVLVIPGEYLIQCQKNFSISGWIFSPHDGASP